VAVWCLKAFPTSLTYDNSVKILKSVIFQEQHLKVLKRYNFLSATMTKPLSSGEFCELRYDTVPVKSASANVSFCTK